MKELERWCSNTRGLPGNSIAIVAISWPRHSCASGLLPVAASTCVYALLERSYCKLTAPVLTMAMSAQQHMPAKLSPFPTAGRKACIISNVSNTLSSLRLCRSWKLRRTQQHWTASCRNSQANMHLRHLTPSLVIAYLQPTSSRHSWMQTWQSASAA